MFLDISTFLEEISSPSYSKAFLSHVLFSALSSVYLCRFPCPSLLFFPQLFVKPQYSTTLPPVMKRSFCLFGWLVFALVLEGLHGTVLLWLLRHQWLGRRLGLLWCWMVCFVSEPRSFCYFWDCTQVLHFGLFCWLWGPLHCTTIQNR